MGRALVCTCLTLLSPLLGATEVKGLYRIETAAPNRDAGARAEDFRRGLAQVLKRVLRSEDFASPAARALIAKPEPYVLQFQYRVGADGPRGVPLLQVDFDPTAIRDALRRKGIEVWSAQRPDLLTWLALEENAQQRLVSATAPPEIEGLVRELAVETGLPMTLPLGDLTDQQALSPTDIDNTLRLRLASERYATEAILAGHLRRTSDGSWGGDWRLLWGEEEQRWQGGPGDLRAVLGSGLGGAYQRLAAHFVGRGTEAASLELKVSGIASLEEANRVAAYLGKLSPVARLEWLEVGAGDASFRLLVRGGREAFRQTLAMGGLLRPVPGGEPGFSGLAYQLVK
ncbi:DUF2066 domain-containing protein [Candidatus Methylocalor cossyra]|uniref:DUF2066 domain-containing protein n=1 Tax=Candidatus Methylocalor cossyra TaxID=3108543 RepID=A0ABP1C5U6_9GAMM